MEKDKSTRAYIESFKDGFIRGWAATTPNLEQSNICDLFVDGVFISSIEAKIYREDLKDASVRFGVAGFLTPVPLVFCDGEEHIVELKINSSDFVITTKHLKFIRNKNQLPLDENIVFDKINKTYKKHKKILVLAGFTNQVQILNYQKHFIETFRKAGFYVVYIIASDSPENLTGILNASDRVIVRRNMGYDFGSWAAFIQICQNEMLLAEEIIWANDSIIGPISSMDDLLEKIDQSDADIWGITDSQDKKYHFQSYFWGIKKKTGQHAPILDAFFFYRKALPQDKQEAINQYEVQALDFFYNQGLRLDILFPEYSLVSLAEDKFCNELKAYSKKWQLILNVDGNKEEEGDNVTEKVLNLANILMNRQATNPSHMYWNVLIDRGFPFIKRELITLNPSNYPFPYQFRAEFEAHKVSYLLDDLAFAFKLSHIV